VTTRAKAVISWSSGKDSAWALHVARETGHLEIVGAITSVTSTYARVSMHGVREEILDCQAEAIGLPLTKVAIPSPCDNQTYETAFGTAMETLRDEGVSVVIFGDLFLEDIRAYREAQLGRLGIEGSFPLWRQPTDKLAREMIAGGVDARITCVDPRVLDSRFAGRRFDEELLGELPPNVDPCGENGEFHTLVVAGPMLRQSIRVTTGETVDRDGFAFADVTLAAS
jgi:uncharacterized protein (TIGR00290 family)